MVASNNFNNWNEYLHHLMYCILCLVIFSTKEIHRKLELLDNIFLLWAIRERLQNNVRRGGGGGGGVCGENGGV